MKNSILVETKIHQKPSMPSNSQCVFNHDITTVKKGNIPFFPPDTPV